MNHKYLKPLYFAAVFHIVPSIYALPTTHYPPVTSQLRNLAILVILTAWLTACNSNTNGNSLPAQTTLSQGNATAGEAVFTENGCMACHALTSDAPPGIGPSLAGVAGRSRETIQDPAYTGAAETVEAYLWESITQPNVHVSQGYQPTMPATYQQSLEEQALADLVAYLLTLN